MRFWKGLIGFLSLGRVGLVEEGDYLVKKCVFEIFSEIEKGHVVEIKAISTSYLPGCFELFTTEDRPAIEEAEGITVCQKSRHTILDYELMTNSCSC